jgi:hypothetical protein
LAAALPPLPEPCDDAALALLAWLWPRDSKKSSSTLPLLFFFFFGGALFLVCDARFDPVREKEHRTGKICQTRRLTAI